MKEKIDGLKDISPEQVRVNAAVFDTVGYLDGSYRVFDKATGFQTSHITSQQDWQWREGLTEEQKQHLMNKNRLAGKIRLQTVNSRCQPRPDVRRFIVQYKKVRQKYGTGLPTNVAQMVQIKRRGYFKQKSRNRCPAIQYRCFCLLF